MKQAAIAGDPGRTPEEIAWNQYEQTHPSMIDKLFAGLQKTIVICGRCNEKSITFNPFMTLSVAFESSLDKCIATFLKEDSLEGRDQYKCEKCKKQGKAKIKTELSKLPNVLVFHLKRFQFPSMKKITGRVQFKTYLDLEKYCKSPLDAKDTLYELFGLTVHIGSLSQGHYIAYTKRTGGKWYMFNDESYEQVKESDVLNQEAYLLFYRKVTL